MAFRKKNKTRELVSQKETIDSIHKKMKSQFQDEYQSLGDQRTELSNIELQIAQLRNSSANKSQIPDFNLQSKIWRLENQADKIRSKIKTLESKTEEQNYLIKTGKLLSKYYKLIEKEKEITEMTSRMDFIDSLEGGKVVHDLQLQKTKGEKKGGIMSMLDASFGQVDSVDQGTSVKRKDKKEKRDIMDWFGESSAPITYNMETNRPTINIKFKSNVGCSSQLEEDKDVAANPISQQGNNTHTTVQQTSRGGDVMDKRKIYDEYMKIIDPNYVPVYEDEFELFDICTSCHSEMVLNHNAGMLNCNNCGMTERIIVDSDKQSHKEPPKEMTSFSYKRINHLNEILSQFQAKETTEIPDYVYDKILLELKKERIENMALLTKDKLREILKKIDETDYYEHIPYIINQLNGLPPPVISPEVEEIIRGLFLQAQHPFNTHCPDARKNFLTYGYTLYKLFELLELDDYLCNFKFLKDRKKLYEQEQIWKKICHELKWEFIPSI